MDRRQKRLLTAGLLLAVLLGAVWELFPLAGAEGRLGNLLRNDPAIASWPVEITPRERTALAAATALRCGYRLPGGDVIATAVDGTRNRHAVHDPTFCLRGAGWRVVDREPVALPGGTAERLQFEKEGQRRQLVYWFSDGRARHASMLRYWWQTTLRRVTLGGSGPEPVLITLQPVADGDSDVAWEAILADLGPLGNL